MILLMSIACDGWGMRPKDGGAEKKEWVEEECGRKLFKLVRMANKKKRRSTAERLSGTRAGFYAV